MQSRLFIHATNIHQGGGRSLLDALLRALKSKVILTADVRLPLQTVTAEDLQYRRVKPSVLQRILAERWLLGAVGGDDIVLCMGNLPPLFRLRGHTVVFLHNRYLVDSVALDGFSLKSKLRLTIERLWFRSRMENADEFLVQTPAMKKLLESRTKGRIPIRISPFISEYFGYTRKLEPSRIWKDKKFDFLYVASGEPHKNHRLLIDAWCLLAAEGLFPSLKLTVDKVSFPSVFSWMRQKIDQYQLKVENLGSLPPDQIKLLYEQAGALIYPSTLESFGLPLIEARQAGLAVLASEKDYVRDVLDPEQTFDPNSAVSIVRAVKRFMRFEEPLLPITDAAEFIEKLFLREK